MEAVETSTSDDVTCEVTDKGITPGLLKSRNSLSRSQLRALLAMADGLTSTITRARSRKLKRQEALDAGPQKDDPEEEDDIDEDEALLCIDAYVPNRRGSYAYGSKPTSRKVHSKDSKPDRVLLEETKGVEHLKLEPGETSYATDRRASYPCVVAEDNVQVLRLKTSTNKLRKKEVKVKTKTSRNSTSNDKAKQPTSSAAGQKPLLPDARDVDTVAPADGESHKQPIAAKDHTTANGEGTLDCAKQSRHAKLGSSRSRAASLPVIEEDHVTKMVALQSKLGRRGSMPQKNVSFGPIFTQRY